jgi:hypothetical protein
MPVVLPDAEDLDPGKIYASKVLIDSAPLLEDREQLDKRYGAEGYLFFSGVLDIHAIEAAFKRMMAVMEHYGIVEPGAQEPIWTGKPLEGNHQEDPLFSGICKELIEHPHNAAVFEKILGEPFCSFPITQYRSYPPFTTQGKVHQDGFTSPGVTNYRGVWMPMMTIDEKIGGLILAPGQHKRGYFHNMGKPPIFPIPEGIIPADAWASTTFHRGDVVVFHPEMPHVGIRNTSHLVRLSIDTRVQSASNPTVFVGNIIELRPDGLTLDCNDGIKRRFAVNEDTFIRTGENTRVRIPLSTFVQETRLGMRAMLAASGDQATMIRRASGD